MTRPEVQQLENAVEALRILDPDGQALVAYHSLIRARGMLGDFQAMSDLARKYIEARGISSDRLLHNAEWRLNYMEDFGWAQILLAKPQDAVGMLWSHADEPGMRPRILVEMCEWNTVPVILRPAFASSIAILKIFRHVRRTRAAFRAPACCLDFFKTATASTARRCKHGSVGVFKPSSGESMGSMNALVDGLIDTSLGDDLTEQECKAYLVAMRGGTEGGNDQSEDMQTLWRGRLPSTGTVLRDMWRTTRGRELAWRGRFKSCRRWK